MVHLNLTPMKRIFTLLLLFAMVSGVSGQMELLVDFESDEDTTYWETFANGAGTKANTISIVPNPAADAVNGSGKVLKFHVKPGCDNWVGMYADSDAPGAHSTAADFAFTDFTGENRTLVYMVYKERNTEVGLKLERSLNGGEVTNVYMPTEKTFEWELVTFEFPENVAGYYYQRLTVFVDHFGEGETRPEDDSTDVYVDNIGVPGSYISTRKEYQGDEMMLYPTPAEHLMAVKYPDGLTGITLTDVMGRQIRTMNFGLTDNKVINVADLPTGIYFITAETIHGGVTMRFLKK